jgi:hypothetical protein
VGPRVPASVAVLLLAACGKEPGTASPPATPEAALAAARSADEAGRDAEVAPLLEAAARGDGEASQVATTWLVTLALEAHDPEAAVPRLERIRTAFGGKGLTKEGRELSLSVLAGAVVEEAAAAVRTRLEGATPDAARAESALKAGTKALAMAEDAPEERAALQAAGKYASLGLAPLELEAWGVSATPSGPRVVALVDDFQLVEPVLPSVLKRWSRGLPVVLVGLAKGTRREGMRRVRSSPQEERASMDEHAKKYGLVVAATLDADGEAIRRSGIDPAGATVLLVDAKGTILRRVAGKGVDPRVLDPDVVRIAPEAAPPGGK